MESHRIPLKQFSRAARSGVSLAAVLLALAAVIWNGAARAASSPLTVRDADTGQLVEVTPAVTIPARPLPLDTAAPDPPFIPFGYDLGANNAPCVTPAEAPEGAPLRLAVYWRVIGVIPRSAQLRLRIAGSGPAYEQTYAMNTTGWIMGGAYRSTLVYTPKGSRYAGDATVSLTLLSSSGAPEAALLAAPIAIRPVNARSTVSNDRIREVFGPGAVRLNVALRLGKGAQFSIPVTKETASAFSGVGIVSATGYSGFFDAGAPVLRLECTDTAAGHETLTLRYGKETLHGDTKALQPPGATLDGVTVFSSEELDKDSPPRRTFAGQLRFHSPRKLDKITLEYAPSTGVLDIAEIVLLP